MREKRNVLTYLAEKEWLIMSLWFGLSFIGAFMEVSRNNFNNYRIFKDVFFHVIHQQPLYIPYPADYYDVNLYGPLFSLVIAPFAGLEIHLGAMLWSLTGSAVLFYAIRQLPLLRMQQNIILLLCSMELMGASSWFQMNQFIGAFIILTFANTVKGKELWAAFFIVLGTLTKFLWYRRTCILLLYPQSQTVYRLPVFMGRGHVCTTHDHIFSPIYYSMLL
ncbi:hypothetical protein QFZ51_000866 [Chitinophaga sp. W3I9]|uniref:glycosyltransferase family 87 protein n=1 Tax=Chitinophaga sp. W3I9 TaxID=3373924 RepID=UPI003D237ABB